MKRSRADWEAEDYRTMRRRRRRKTERTTGLFCVHVKTHKCQRMKSHLQVLVVWLFWLFKYYDWTQRPPPRLGHSCENKKIPETFSRTRFWAKVSCLLTCWEWMGQKHCGVNMTIYCTQVVHNSTSYYCDIIFVIIVTGFTMIHLWEHALMVSHESRGLHHITVWLKLGI